MPTARSEEISHELMGLLGTAKQVKPYSLRYSDFGLEDAYSVVSQVCALRSHRGEYPIGRKIGFTNRALWATLGIEAPIWNFMFNTTVALASNGRARTRVSALPEPRIEPELVLHLAAEPSYGMTTAELLACVDWVAPAFEVVSSIFPGWRFTAGDAAAAYGVHSALIVGNALDLSGQEASQSLKHLSTFTVELKSRSGEYRRGQATDILGGPLESLGFLVKEIERHCPTERIRPGELITTGTLTEAMPAQRGETWQVCFTGLALAPLTADLD